MSYRNYFDKADEIARTSFSEYQAASAAFEEAKKKAAEYPRRTGASPGYQAIWARRRADELEASEAYNLSRKRLEASQRDFSRLRDELAEEIANKAVLDPSKVDQGTLTILQSGIAKAADYRSMISKAKGNATMTRLLAKAAADAAADEKDPGEARLLRAAAHEARQSLEDPALEAFDSLNRVYQRTVSNAAMMPRWNQFVKDCLAAAGESDEGGNE